MRQNSYICNVQKNEPIGKNCFDMEFICPEMAKDAWPGQFLHIWCGKEQTLRRPISICGTFGDRVRIVYQIKGEGTKNLSKIKAGDTVDVLGPLGNGFSKDYENEEIIVVGGGVGAAPMLFCANTYRVDAVLGFQSRGAMILAQDFFAVCENRISICTEDGSYGHTGLVTEPLAKILQLKKHKAVFACGPKPMLKAVAKLSKEYNLPCYVSLEERMGCGVGACLTCAVACMDEKGEVSYQRVCRDGPVFNSRKVIWND